MPPLGKMGVTPIGKDRGPPSERMGYPLSGRMRVPLPHQNLIGGIPISGLGYPPGVWTDTQSENITLLHPSDVDGKLSLAHFGQSYLNRIAGDRRPQLVEKYIKKIKISRKY